jgi:hypothetical protein
VPPIYQPEVAAQAIVWASRHRRREVWVGGSTVGTIAAEKMMPGLLDRYLAATGFTSQQSDQPGDPNRPFNLWEPVPGDRGAHGRFDRRAHHRSFQLWATTHRPLVALFGAVGGVALAALSRRSRLRA